VSAQKPLPRTQVREAERKLSELGYWTGAVDGRLDAASQSALVTFQKWERPARHRPLDARGT
jgi:hypothetical protein